MPPGTTPPLILNYNASTVPILQLANSSRTLSEQQVLDLSQNFIRPVLTTVQGAAIPFSYGGRVRQVQVDLDPQALQAKGLSAQDVQNAIANQNQIMPAGNVKIGPLSICACSSTTPPTTIEELNDLPVKTVNGATIYMHDVGHVRDGSPPQQSIVHVDGARAVLQTILKTGSASTLDVVQGVKDMLPKILATLPPRSEDRSAQRPVAVREGRDSGRDARRRHRGGADQPDDPAVPRQLAFDRDHRHVDPAGGALRR